MSAAFRNRGRVSLSKLRQTTFEPLHPAVPACAEFEQECLGTGVIVSACFGFLLLFFLSVAYRYVQFPEISRWCSPETLRSFS